ncbi:MAG: glycosyltransferase family 39 protein [Vicingaceae bacterium]|nr:glycosyltransferase family 39 protein [Vicingaceae bacterium]
MPFSYFSQQQLTPLIISALLFISSIILFNRKTTLSIVLLFLGALVLGFFIANLDPFLILWDEQYHALVAKNMLQNPFKPTLFLDPQFDYNYKNWTANHVWLHKQPLFLWQMALSIKMFGVNALAVRTPSIIMHAIVPLFIYRIGSMIIDKRLGYIAALLFAVAYFPLELVAGRYSTDHNDIAFLFYVTASFWSWFEYQKSKNPRWLILIGLFSGAAVLVKWLMGTLVFILWFISKSITQPKSFFKIKSYTHMAITTIICLVVFIPWQIYIINAFPLESLYEYTSTSSHFTNTVESHSGGFLFHFTIGLKALYGSGVAIPFILLAGIIFMLKAIKEKIYKIFIITAISFIYIFYSIATTKMIAFTIIAMPFIYLGLSYLFYLTLNFIEVKLKPKLIGYSLSTIVLLAILFTVLNLSTIENYHTMKKPHDNHEREKELLEMKVINSLEGFLEGEDYIIFNMNITEQGHIPTMFYTSHTAYNYIPTENQIKQLKEKSKKIAVLKTDELPNYITSNPTIKVIDLKTIIDGNSI